MLSKQDVLQASNFGERVAEEESKELQNYFVETDQWAKIYAGDIDIVYGPKGSGKSAIYSLLIQRTNDLFDRGILLVGAERLRGAPVFRDIRQNPPTTEEEFVGLWKLYFATLIASKLRDFDANSGPARNLYGPLEAANLLPKEFDLARLLRGAFDYARSFFRPSGVEAEVKLDPHTGLPTGFGGKITFTQPDSKGAEDVVSVDELLRFADAALADQEITLWILLDRLDVAFAESPELEENALCALFRVYLDFLSLERIRTKIFLRSDIWRRITAGGFREASHITRSITISWNRGSFANLIARRLLKNQSICEYYLVSSQSVLSSMQSQFELFYKVFPNQVEVGPNKSETFDWILTRTRDGTGETAPRELIHLLNCARNVQLRQLEVGAHEPEDSLLFSKTSLKEALPEVSKVRLEQTLFAEFPKLRTYIEKLSGEKTLQLPSSLARIWKVSENEASEVAAELCTAGFFERRGTKDAPSFWVPFLYRDAAKMIQGSAEP